MGGVGVESTGYDDIFKNNAFSGAIFDELRLISLKLRVTFENRTSFFVKKTHNFFSQDKKIVAPPRRIPVD